MQPGSTPNINRMFTRWLCTPSKIKDKQDLLALRLSFRTAGTHFNICKHFSEVVHKKISLRAAIRCKQVLQMIKKKNIELTRFRQPRPSEQQVNRASVSKRFWHARTFMCRRPWPHRDAPPLSSVKATSYDITNAPLLYCWPKTKEPNAQLQAHPGVTTLNDPTCPTVITRVYKRAKQLHQTSAGIVQR